ncbi:MAG: hypothetical protein OXH96_21550 [Spirochaetaceae bacterium]|nr:hypothetical protein [Spirochaetaceae bacterium]
MHVRRSSAIERGLDLLRGRRGPLSGVRIDEHLCEGVASLVVLQQRSRHRPSCWWGM